jgi:hypothetical protein
MQINTKQLFLNHITSHHITPTPTHTHTPVVLRTPDVESSDKLIGVYPVIRKWQRGVGISDATSPIRSLFIYPGYRSVVVLAAITVETSEFSWFTVGFASFRRSTAMRLSAVLSRTTTASAWRVRRWSD